MKKIGERRFALAGGCSLLRFGRKEAEIKLPAYGGSDKISALSFFSLSYADAALPMLAPKPCSSYTHEYPTLSDMNKLSVKLMEEIK